MRKLIADSGGTKADWACISEDKVLWEMQTEGLQPNNKTPEFINEQLQLVLDKGEDIAELHFYGAGCSSKGNIEYLTQLFQSKFPKAKIYLACDLVGAGISLLGDGEGMIGILGTGSNSAVFKDAKIVQTRPSYGFLLGDEGSGSFIGKRFLKRALEREFSEDLLKEIENAFDLNENYVVQQLYHQKSPSAYFGSFLPFIKEHAKEYPGLSHLLIEAFEEYIHYFLTCYAQHAYTELNLVGSIGVHFKKYIEEALEKHGYCLGKVIAKPMKGLITYHSGGKL